MKQILFIHPIGQSFALLFGFFNTITGCTRRWFNLPIHINCGAIYYFVSLSGAGMGVFVSKWAHKNGIVYDMDIHELAAMLMVLCLAIGATTGFIMLINKEKRLGLLKYHRWVNIFGLFIFCLQGITGISLLIKLFK